MIADDLSRISMSAGLATTVSRAVDYARSQGHQEVTLEHMLMALCDDPDAALVLAASNIDTARIRAEVADYLGGMGGRAAPYGQGGDPVVSADLIRILEAAAAAARGGRRREINGAIVLAAIVGDGKSPAAELLRAQGLTFEGAIRALQSARQTTAPPTAGDILAGARERVQARARGPVYPAQRVEPEAPLPAPPAPEPEPEVAPEVEESYPELGETSPEAHPAAVAPGASGSEWDIGQGATDEATKYDAPGEHGLFSLRPERSTDTAQPAEMPASAPFPPPLPIPQVGAGSAPPPSKDQGMLAGPARPTPPPLPPAAPVRVGAAEPRPPTPWPDVLPQRPQGVGSGTTFRPRVEGIGAAADGPPLRHSRRVAASDSALPSFSGARPAGARVRAEVGQLVENIPRTMRVAVPVLVEVRIARSDVRNLAEGMQGGTDAHQHEIKITKVMSVSLRAPDGGFFIESASPETQFVDGSHTLSTDDFASWRWHVTPRQKGKKRLQLVISARTIADGLVAETALPDQVISVRVRTNYGKTFVRGFGWIVAAVAGGLIAKFGEGAFDAGWRVISGFIQ